MRSFRSDPFLWIHLAGLAAFPILLGLCLVGLAMGAPLLPIWLELFLVGAAGIVPILGMQLFRPFYIFSTLVVAMKPERLTPERQRILSLFKSPAHQMLSILVAVFLAVALWPIYWWSPIAASVAPSDWRPAGLVLAALAFLGCNLFLQVPVSVARLMLASDAKFAGTSPYPLEKIRQDFTSLGLQVNQILPALEAEPGTVTAASAAATPQPISPPAAGEPTSTSNPTESA